eukprot:TRINITY_DN7709_c0_g1_i1.p1 TRINITY_DN7709_c0_g1~~TRINITY_DN7709_c0_g1_i1.p1  ORF type:complete len:899 (+),score=326.88 TRINITY_DN7709_c0_g1_i1:160-2697(+)
MGKPDEAWALAETVPKTDLDDSLIHSFSMLYKSMYRMDALVDLYETAFKKHPKNEELLIGAFQAYIRKNDVAKEKETAMRLWKTFPQPKYFLWVIQATLRMAQLPGGESNLVFAQRLMEKAIEEKKVTTVEDLELYLNILKEQKDTDKIIKTLEGPLGKLMKLERDVVERRAALYTQNGADPNSLPESHRTDAASIYRKLIEEYDEWHHWKEYMRLEKPDVVNELIRQKLAALESKNKSRTPYLAEMEMLHMTGASDPIVQKLQEYVAIFGSKPCCFSDVSMYLKHIKDPKSFSTQLHARFEGEQKELTPHFIQEYISWLQISRKLGVQKSMSVEDKLKLIQEAFLYYEASEKIKKEVTELCLGDDILIIVTRLLREISVEEKNPVPLLTLAIAILEYGILRSKYSWLIKFELIQLYANLSAIDPAIDHFHKLDVKHILWETIGYKIFDHVMRLGHAEEAYHCCNYLFLFHEDNRKQTPEYIVKAYGFGTYSKIPEFFAFKEKLENSEQLAIATTEWILLQFQLPAENPTELPNLGRLPQQLSNLNPSLFDTDEKLKKLRFNQDFEVTVDWEPEGSEIYMKFPTPGSTSAQVEKIPQVEQLQHLKLRNLFIMNLSYLVQYDMTQVATTTLQLEQTISQLEKSTVLTNFDLKMWKILGKGFRISELVFSGLKESQLTGQNAAQIETQLTDWVKSIQDLGDEVLEELTSSPRLPLGKLVALHNAMLMSLLIVERWHACLPAAKKKKGTDSADIVLLRSSIKNFGNAMAAHLAKVKESCKNLDAGFRKDGDGDRVESIVPLLKFSRVEEFTKTRQDVLRGIQRSHAASLQRLEKQILRSEALAKTLKA